MEIVQPVAPRPIQIVLFDFDGTLSLMRTGWQQVMVRLMSEVLSSNDRKSGVKHLALPNLNHPGQQCRFDTDSAELRGYLREVVDNTTGQQTIDQMLLLAQLEQGLYHHEPDPNHDGLSERALQLKAIYLERLKENMDARMQSLTSGARTASDFLIQGAANFLDWLARRRVKLCLISGTDHDSVLSEAKLLGISAFFEDRIFGGLNVTGAFTKKHAMQQVLACHAADSSNAIAFGDGIMDIRSAKEVGVLAIGVASDEIKGTGLDPVKRKQLIGAGADAIIGDYGSFQEWIREVMV